MQHLLFPRRLITSDSATSLQSVSVSDEIAKSVAALPQNLSELFHNLTEDPPSASVDPGSSFSLHSLLAALDPAVAARWHWRDTRKVHRSIKIIKERGQRVSEILTEQAQEDLQPRFALKSILNY
jgi:tRNA dimethylallyltransferase